MEVLLVDPLVPEAMTWLQERHEVSFKPELADDPIELRKHTYKTRAIVLPPHVVVSKEFLDFSPKLQVVARMQVSSDNTDLDACARRNVRVVQARSATVRSNAEYLLYGLLMLYRRGMVSALLGRKLSQVRMGRELAGSTVGLLGLAPVAHTLAPMLKSLGVRLLGYDFLNASAAAKMINVATNLSALMLFSFKGHVWWHLALAMGAANIVGSLIGTRLALKHGAGFVRHVFIVVVLALICKTAYDTWLKA